MWRGAAVRVGRFIGVPLLLLVEENWREGEGVRDASIESRQQTEPPAVPSCDVTLCIT